jgi:prepilin-type N-terminal cleavage/methylation domain-containing protein
MIKGWAGLEKMIIRSRAAFTLVELLVVIAIIGLLSALVVVATSGLREQADINKVLAWVKRADVSFKDNLMGSWSMDKTSAIHNSIIFDSSGQGNHGTLYTSDGTTNKAVAGMVNNALRFDGINDYVQLPDTGSLTSFTIVGWIKGEGDSLSGATGYNTFIGRASNRRLLYNTGGLMLAQMGPGNHWSTITAPRGRWNHIVYAYDAATNTAKWYINGQPDSEFVGATSFSSPYRIGSYDNVNYMMNGLIDEIRIYDIALTVSQIQSHYCAGLNKLLAKGMINQEEYQEKMNLN